MSMSTFTRSVSSFQSAPLQPPPARTTLARAVAKWFEALEPRRLFAAVLTDKIDYGFGETAFITGSGFAAQELVQLQVQHVAGSEGSNDDEQNAPWQVSADAEGNVTATWVVDDPDAPNASYMLTALGLTSGEIATTLFTDSVTVTPATGGTNVSADKAANAASPQYTTLGSIVIAEPGSGKQDIAPSQTNATLILTAPSNWEFRAGFGSVSFASGNNLTAASINVTATTITVTLSTNSGSMSDTLTISNIQVRALDGALAPASGTIVRSSANPGTGTIVGVTNNVTPFGTLSQARGAATRFTLTAPAATVVGQPASVTVTAFDQFDNLVTAYTGTVRFTSSDAAATLPADYTFVAGDNGSRTFTNGVTLRNAGTRTITATDTVNAAVLGADSVTVTESGTSTTLTSSANPSLSSQSVTFTAAVAAAAPGSGTPTGTVTFMHGDEILATVALNASGQAIFSTADISRGSNSITAIYEGSSNYLTSNSSTLTQVVNNRAPVANAQPVVTNEDAPLSGSLTANDPEGDALTYVIVSNPSNGTITSFDADTGDFTYTPNPDYFGADSFTFKVNDGTADSTTAVVSITVNSVNDAPSFTKGDDQTRLEDAGAQSIAGWATNLTRGPANEAGQTLSFIVSNDNNALFSVQPTISATGALTFTPAANANGTATVTVQIKDNGGTANGGVDTSVAQTFTITLTPVNNAPSFTKGTNQTVNEDAAAQTIANWATSISKGPANEASQEVEFLVSNNTNALFLVQPAISPNGTLSYTLSPDANGMATVTVQIKDNGGTANGGVDTSAAQTFTITVNAVNDAPVLSTVSTTLPSINEDETGNTGIAISALVAGLTITDVDSGALKGIAVVSADSANGVWQYSINGGSNWTAFTASPTTARLLADSATTRIRFVPSANFNGVAGISFRAWDQSSGTNGGSADASANGGTSAFSGTTAVATVTVNPVNDAPVLVTTTVVLPSIDEDQTTNTGVSVAAFIAGLSVTDVDAAALKGIAVTSVNNTNGTWEFSTDGGETWTAFGSPSAAASRLLTDSAANRIRFVPSADYNGTATFTCRAWDQTSGTNGSTVSTTTNGGTTAFSSASGTATITVSAVNDAPVIILPGGAVTYSSGSAAVIIDAGATISDVDTSVFTGGTLTVDFAANGSADDQLSIHNEGNGGGKLNIQGSNVRISSTIVGTFSGGVGTTPLVITFNSEATTAVVQQVLRNITFGNVSSNPSTLSRSVRFVMTDGAGAAGAASEAATKIVIVSDVNDAPVLNTTAATVPAILEDDFANAGVDVTAFIATLTITDADHSPLKGLAITGANNANGTWQYSINGGSTWTAVGSPSDGVVRLLSNSADNRIRFVPNADYSGTATFTFRAWDQTTGANGGTANAASNGGATAFSAASGTATITVTDVNDAPTLNAISNPAAINEDAGLQTINLTGISAGSVHESSQAITITAVSSNPSLIADPTINYTSPNATGTLTFTPLPNAHGSAVITVTVTDNGGTSNGGVNTVTRTFTVNVTPINDVPSFVKGSNVLVDNNSGAQTVSGWATSMSAGPANEAAQTLQFLVSNDNNALFEVQPTISADGTLTFTPATNASGIATVTVRLKDDGGTANGGVDTSEIQTFTIKVNDTIAPDAPIITGYTTDSGIAGDFITNDTTPTLSGTAEANSVVNVYDGESLLGDATASAAGAWFFTPASLVDGMYSLTVKARDASGNVSVASTPLVLTIDATPPAAPSQPDLAAGSDSGASSTDHITKVNTPTFTGAAESGSTVTIYAGGVAIGSGVAVDGQYSVVVSTLADGVRNITATATDAAGNVSQLSTPLAVTIDTAAPAAPSITGFGDDTGVLGDGITSDLTPTLTGVAEAFSHVSLFHGLSLLGSVTADGAGAWSLTLPQLTGGAHSIVAQASDAAGNVSTASASLPITIDATPASITLGGSSGSETDAQQQQFSWGVTDAVGLGAVSVSVTRNGASIFSSSDASGSFDFDAAGLGDYQISVSATDTAGNVASDTRTVTVTDDDSTPPVITLGGSEGTQTDGDSNVFTWSATDPGSGISAGSVGVTVTRNGEVVFTSSDASGMFDFKSLGLGTYVITVSASDADADHANDSLSSLATRTVIVTDDDSAAPVITLGGAEGTRTDGQSNALTWNVTDAGSGLASVLISVTRDGAEIFTSTDASGSFSLDGLGLGTYQISVSATDADADRNDDSLTSSATRSVTVIDDDTTAPVIVLGGSQGTETDGADNVFTWSVSDAGAGLDTVSVTVTRNGETVFTSSNATGSFDFNALGMGTYEISVTATDADADRTGDSLLSSATRTVTVSDDDTTAPAITLGGAEGTRNDGQSNALTWNVSDADSGLASATVSVTRNGVEIFTSTDASGSFSLDGIGLGTYQISVSATDADADRTGDSLTSSSSRSVTVVDDDDVAPTITLSGAQGTVLDSQSQSVSWDVTDNVGLGSVLVTVTRNGVTVFSTSSVAGTIDLAEYGLGAYQISVSATDSDDDRTGDSLTSIATRSITVVDDDSDLPVITLGGSSGFESHSLSQLFTWNIADASGIGSASIEILKDGVTVFTSTDVTGSYNFDALGLGLFEIRVSAVDGDNDRTGDAAEATASRTVSVTNASPLAAAGADRTVQSGQAITFNGSGSSDADGDALTYTWDFGDGTTAVGLSPVHTYSIAGSYLVTITVADGMGGTHSDSAAITVNAVVAPPTAPTLAVSIKGPKTAVEGALVNLTRTVPGSSSFTHLWNVTSSNGQVIAQGTAATFSFQPNDNGTYVITLAVTNSAGAYGLASSTVMVSNAAPTAKVQNKAPSSQYSDDIAPVTIIATDRSEADVLSASIISGLPANSGLSIDWDAALRKGTLSGRANLAPGTYNVKVRISDDDGGYSDVTVPLTITRENALASYTGDKLMLTPVNGSSVTVQLRAVIRELSAESWALDCLPGDIRNATVTFINRETKQVIAANVPITLLDPSDPMSGVASFNWNVNLGSASFKTFTVGIVVNKHYTRDSSEDNAVVTVAKPLAGTVTGGGSMFQGTGAAGLLVPAPGTTTDFGFSVKPGSKPTGGVSMIIRSYYRTNGTKDTTLHVYQITGTSITAATSWLEGGIRRSNFTAKVNIFDITNPASPLKVGTNLTINVTGGASAGGDHTVNLSLWNGNTLWYTNSRSGGLLIEQLLEGGELQFR